MTLASPFSQGTSEILQRTELHYHLKCQIHSEPGVHHFAHVERALSSCLVCYQLLNTPSNTLQTLQNACASTGVLELADGDSDTMLTLSSTEVEAVRSEITRLLSTTIGCFHDNQSKLVAHFSNTGPAEDIAV